MRLSFLSVAFLSCSCSFSAIADTTNGSATTAAQSTTKPATTTNPHPTNGAAVPSAKSPAATRPATKPIAATAAQPAPPGMRTITLPGRHGRPARTFQVPIHKAGDPEEFKKLDVGIADTSLWFRYFRAGEDAQLKKNDSLAKQYWLQSLTELEKVKTHVTDDLNELVKISALEQALTMAYPKDWSKLEIPQDEVMKQRNEQVNTLYRIAQINDRWVPKGNLLLTKSKERYTIARSAYEKAVADNKKSPPQQPQEQ